jgi:hypothetical protein
VKEVNLEEIQRALDVAGVGSVLSQPEIHRIIAELVEYKNPIRQNLPRKKGSGLAAYVNRRTAAGTPAEFVDDRDEPVESTGDYNQVNFPYKTILRRGKVTRKAQAVGRSYIDIAASEIESCVREYKDFEEWAYFWGRTEISAKYFDGLYRLIPPTQRVGTTTDADGKAMTLSDLDAVIHKCAGNPDMIFCSKAVGRQLWASLQAQQRFVNETEVRGGFKVPTYQGIPVFLSTRIHDNLNYDGSTPTPPTDFSGGTGSTSVLFVVDTQELWIEELTSLTIAPLAKKSSQYEEFDIYCDEAMVMRNPLYHSALVGIKV